MLKSKKKPKNNQERFIYNFVARQFDDTPLLEYDMDEMLTDEYIKGIEKVIEAGHLSKENIKRWRKFVAEKDYRYSQYMLCFLDDNEGDNLPKAVNDE